uniref:Uncharacterized protein n=1 Tax=Anguilla anguilla TaxID=7936 RepID=A0A0E9SHI6_ANGAN
MKTHIALCFFYFSCIFQHKQETLRRGRYSQSLKIHYFLVSQPLYLFFILQPEANVK